MELHHRVREGKARLGGYDVEELYDCTDRNVSRYGCVRAARGTWMAAEGDEVESQCLSLSLLSRADWFMRTVASITAFEDDTDEIDYLDVLRRHAPPAPPDRSVSMSIWVVTALVEDGSWAPVEVEAETMTEAVDCALSLDWVENVVECQRVE